MGQGTVPWKIIMLIFTICGRLDPKKRNRSLGQSETPIFSLPNARKPLPSSITAPSNQKTSNTTQLMKLSCWQESH